MKKSVVLIITLFIGLNVFGQVGRNMNDRIPQTNRQLTEKDIEKRNRLMKERRDEFVSNFLSTLEADDFQKEIIRQNLDTYYDAKMAILKTNFEHHFDREQAIKKLDDTHFVELEELISEGDMTKIKEMIKGNFDESEVKKENKKKKRRKNKN